MSNGEPVEIRRRGMSGDLGQKGLYAGFTGISHARATPGTHAVAGLPRQRDCWVVSGGDGGVPAQRRIRMSRTIMTEIRTKTIVVTRLRKRGRATSVAEEVSDMAPP